MDSNKKLTNSWRVKIVLKERSHMHRILIVDEDEATLMFYADELEEEGYQVIARSNGSKLLKLIEREKPDLVILDIKLGQYNGLDLLQDIRNIYHNLPLIICTAYPFFKNDMRSIAADYYVIKSSNLKDLKMKLKVAFGEKIPSPSSANHGRDHEVKANPMRQMELHFKERNTNTVL
jgi:DNA-binding response OmpR family regulator